MSTTTTSPTNNTLGLGLSSPSPSENTIPKPHIPARSKARASICLGTSTPLMPVTNNNTPIVRETENGRMGGLNERSDDSLEKATREELEEALRKEWTERDSMLTRLGELQDEQQNLIKQQSESATTINKLENRVNESNEEVSRLEDGIAVSDTIIERLRARVTQLEKEKKDAERRYSEQEKAFDTERQSFTANEQHLKARLQSFTMSKRSSSSLNTISPPVEEEEGDEESGARVSFSGDITDQDYPSSRPISPARSSISHNLITPKAHQEVVESLSATQSELCQLTNSHTLLKAHMDAMAREVSELKGLTSRLQEENEGYETLLMENTLSGEMRFNETYSEDGDIQEEDEEEKVEEQKPERPAARKRLSNLSMLSSLEAVTEAEEEEEEAFSEEPVSNEKSVEEAVAAAVEAKQEEIKAIQAELKSTKDANKALSLYCSKIIDRIISQEGFEKILAADYQNPTIGRKGLTTKKATKKAARPSLAAAVKDMKAGSVEAAPTTEASAGAAQAEVAEEKASADEELSEAAQIQNRKPRGSIIPVDWKVFNPFKATGPTPVTTPSTPTTPVAAEAVVAPASPAPSESSRRASEPPRSASEAPPPFGAASPGPSPIRRESSATMYKRIKYEEDEEDIAERARLAATLKLMGVDKETGSSPSTTPVNLSIGLPLMSPPAPVASLRRDSSFSSFMSLPPALRRDSSASSFTTTSSASGAQSRRSSSRLSNFFGIGVANPSPLEPEIQKLDPFQPVTDDVARAALESYDMREKEQMKKVSKGAASPVLTPSSPDLSEKIATRRATRDMASPSENGSSSAYSSPAMSTNTPVVGDYFGERRGSSESGHATKPSVDTLWSMGPSEGGPRSPDIENPRDVGLAV